MDCHGRTALSAIHGLPQADRFFYRSYCEEVLIVRVHREIIRSEGPPDVLRDDKMVGHGCALA